MKNLTFMVLVLALLVFAGCTNTDGPAKVDEPMDDGPIKIGMIVPITGDLATLGLAAKDAAVLAVDEVNAAGGVNGRQVKLIIEDGKCNGKEGAAAASKLANVDQVSLVIGGFCSPETMAAAPIFEQAKVVALSPCSSAPGVTDAGDFIFRAYPSDAFQGVYAADYLYDQGYRNVGMMTCLNDWCQGLRQTFGDRFEELGGTIVAYESFEGTSRDLRTQITKVKDAEPDALYFAAFTESGVAGIKQIRELNWDIPILGGDTFSDPLIASETGEAGTGVLHVAPSTDPPEEFITNYLGTTGREDIPLCTPQTYDIASIFLKVLSEGATSGEEIRDALYGMETYPGVAGPISFDENGDLKSAVYAIFEYQNGEIIVQGGNAQ